jgi:eukaryotic-like serine/threonine-protein kinase
MVTASGAKVVDFGIAAAIGPAAPEEMLVGTPAYLAPERLTGDAVQPASDVYALGVLLYRLLAHEAPWTVETTTQMLNAHIYLEPAPLPALPGVPPDVADLVDRCLRKDPAERPSAAEVSATLGDAAEASLLSVRGDEAPPSLPAPRAVDEEFDESTSVSARRRPQESSRGQGQTIPASAEVPSGAGASRAEGGAAAFFVPGAEIGAVREPLPGQEREGRDGPDPAGGPDGGTIRTGSAGTGSGDRGGRRSANGGATAGGPGDAARRPGNSRDPGRRDGTGNDQKGRDRGRRGAGGHGSGNERDDQLGGTRVERHPGQPGGAGSWVPEARPAPQVDAERSDAGGGEADPVRKRRRKYLLAGGGVAAVLAAALIWWGLSGGTEAAQTPSGNVDGVVVAPPSGAARPVPTASGDGSATLPDGTVVTGRSALGATGSTSSAAPSARASATSTEGTPRPSSSAASSAPSASEGTRLTSAGGVVYAVCNQGKAQLTSWEPAAGYTVDKVNQGPAIAPEIVFRGASARYRMTVTCVAGTPTPLVLPL